MDLATINVGTTIEIVIDHPLWQVLQMSLEGLKYPFHDHTLAKKIRKSGHDHGIQHVDLQKVAIPDSEAVEGYAFHQSDTRNGLVFSIVDISTIADGKCVVNGEVQSMYVCPD